MFAKSKSVFVSLVVICLTSAAGVSSAQTIDEITELNRQKVILDLKKQLESAKPAPSAVPVVIETRRHRAEPPVTTEVVLPPPKVAAIYGARPDALTTVLVVPGMRSTRAVVGDVLPSGWIIEKITPMAVHLRLKDRVATVGVSDVNSLFPAQTSGAAPVPMPGPVPSMTVPFEQVARGGAR